MDANADIEQGFIEAYDEYADAIFRHCAYRMGDRELGKDLMQDTFFKAWQAIEKGTEVDNMRAFLYKIANNLIVDTVRRQKKRRVDSLETMQEEKGFDLPDKAKSAGHVFDARLALNTLQLVEEPYRTAVVLRHIDGVPVKEMAKMLKITENAASVRINRGLKKLRTLVEKDE